MAHSEIVEEVISLDNTRFERVAAYPNAILPIRETKDSVGYDMFCAEETIVPAHGLARIPTGVKCYLNAGIFADYWLLLALRSSTPEKKGLMLANGIGIIEADYADNPKNEGHIMGLVYNFTDEPIVVKEGERILQGIIMQRHVLGRDNTTGDERKGGFGSTT